MIINLSMLLMCSTRLVDIITGPYEEQEIHLNRRRGLIKVPIYMCSRFSRTYMKIKPDTLSG